MSHYKHYPILLFGAVNLSDRGACGLPRQILVLSRPLLLPERKFPIKIVLVQRL